MQGDSMAMINSLFPFIIMGAVFYFMLWRPQKQQQKARKTLLDELKVGDKVITLGGLLGEITKIDDLHVTLKVANNVEMEFLRTAVGHLQKDVTKAE